MEAILEREIIVGKTASRIFGVTAFIIFTALGAFVRIPLMFTPVPVTLQTMFVLLGAALLGRPLGATTQILYMFLGFAGLPIFTGAGSGLLYLSGPTGGYIFGFLIASIFLGSAIKRAGNSLFLLFGLFLAADAILFACGILWLRILFAFPPHHLLFIGLLPFVPGEILKISAAVILYRKIAPRAKAWF